LEIAMRAAKNSAAPAAKPQPYTIARQDKSRWWEVRDAAGELVCLAVYRRGARGGAPAERGRGVRQERAAASGTSATAGCQAKPYGK
jgi:hypothetical protein